MEHFESFFTFYDTDLQYITSNGIKYIAIKPICTAMNVDYGTQLTKIRECPILSLEYRLHKVLAADNKYRDMACLPEAFFYGWLFSIRSEAPGLIEYKKECYRIIHNSMIRKK